jgi:DNA helicase-2/ATP-dependent DNA helicase PcrA
MTAHSAKGLEWENVFVFELNEQIFPSPKCRTRDALEEERRLCYVAMTRARSRLFLTSSYGCNAYNDACEPSRFVSDVDKGLIQFEKPLRDNGYSSYKQPTYSTIEHKRFSRGDVVNHKVFGKGVIKDVDSKEDCYVIKFDNFQNLKSISFSAKLESVEQNAHKPMEAERIEKISKKFQLMK